MEDQPVEAEPRPLQGPLDERRLALEAERLRFERQKAGAELRLKRRELKGGGKKSWADLLANPLTLAIVGGFLTLMTTTVAGHFSTSENITAETAKARQALQTDLIKKFVDNPNPQTVRANLRFLVDVGLVPDYAKDLKTFLDKNGDSALPSSFTTGASALAGIHTDDDAIDLVIKLEGGYAGDPRDKDSSTKFGISLSTLSTYLGKQASDDDLRNLSAETARDVYRTLYLRGGASGIASVQVKAAYLSLATNLGPRRAGQLFETAAIKVGNTPLTTDGILGPFVLQVINAAEPDQFIETANCEAAKFYEKQPSFNLFGRRWMERLRMFSPATLKGLCQELQPPSSPAP